LAKCGWLKSQALFQGIIWILAFTGMVVFNKDICILTLTTQRCELLKKQFVKFDVKKL
jgi:hypothetical protein